MRINQFLANALGISRRYADRAIQDRRVKVNGLVAKLGQTVAETDEIKYDNKVVKLKKEFRTIMLNKPVGYVVSRNAQGGKSVYELLPQELHSLKPVGRIDKDSSGLVLFSSDGTFINRLTHPRYQKKKVYNILLNKDLAPEDRNHIIQGVDLEDGKSSLTLYGGGKHWQVTMTEGRNRQIRRTFQAVGYQVVSLHRTDSGDYHLGNLKSGHWIFVKT